MQMDRPARRRQMLHRREHGRLVVQGRAVVCKTETCAGCEDMSEKCGDLTRIVRNADENRQDHLASMAPLSAGITLS